MKTNQNIPKLLQPTPKSEVIRTASAVQVRVAAPGFSEYRYASGANLARILQRLDSSVDFIMITSFRAHGQNDKDGPITLKDNINTFTQLPGEIRSALGTKRIGAYWLVGHWTTCSLDDVPLAQCEAEGGKVTDSLEYSWLMTRDDDSVTPEAWLDAAMGIAAKYDQNSFIIRLEGKTTIRRSNGSVDGTLTTDSAIVNAWKDLAQEREKTSGQGYSEVRKLRERGRMQPLLMRRTEEAPSETEKTSAYRVTSCSAPAEMEFFQAVPDNNSGRQMFHSLGIKSEL
jgi:hypothetical protein